MQTSDRLVCSRTVEPGAARLPGRALERDAGASPLPAYVAVRSRHATSVPFVPWTVLAVAPGTAAAPNSVEVNAKSLLRASHGAEIVWTRVQPPPLTHIVLVCESTDRFEQLRANAAALPASLPRLARQGQAVPELQAFIAACEPVDQGLVDPHLLTVSVIKGPPPPGSPEHDARPAPDFSVDMFLSSSPPASCAATLDVACLRSPVHPSSILPPMDPHEDPLNLGFLHVEGLARLGVFSGDFVRLRTDTKTRVIRLYSHPDAAQATPSQISLPPLLVYNLGSPASITVERLVAADPLPVAKGVTLSRVSSPVSTERANQSAFLHGLKAYFATSVRIVANGDTIAIPINTGLAKLVSGPAHEDEDAEYASLILDEDSQPDAVAWFKVLGLPSDDVQYVINPVHTRMVQSGLDQSLAPPTDLHWPQFLGLTPTFDYLAAPQNLFSYAHYLRRLLQASLTPRGATLKTTILLKSSKRGAGKATVLHSVAARLGIHEMVLNAYDLIGDTDGKTLATLKARLERGASTNTCLVTLLHIEALAKKNDVDGKDTPLVNGLLDVFHDVVGRNGMILAASVSDPDVLANSVRNKFKFEVDVSVPSEPERKEILRYLLAPHSSHREESHLLVPKFPANALIGFDLRSDVSLDSLALQSAGLTPPDLKAIVRTAKQLAHERASLESVISQGGIIKLTPEDLEKAISDARGKYSDSIGAPKIPSVGWKDVGGLDVVKGEIMDTIEMPLKHPELFASGLKKRSGILFYGPPGTGKTLLAKAIATSFSLNFFSVKGPELLNMYIGESEANVRRVFQKARDAKPCVVFFDELDSVAPKRGNKGDSGGVMDRIVSQLLAELDGMSEGSDGVFVIGATNRPDLLDEALLRPGRFDKMLYLGVSDTHEKQKTILEALTRKFDLDPQVDLSEIVAQCPFTYTGADFYAMSSDAMLNAMTRTANEIDAKIAAYNDAHPEDPISIRKWFQDVATEEDTHVRVATEDFEKAQRDLVPSVSADELAHYLRVRQTFEGTADTDKKKEKQSAQPNAPQIKQKGHGSSNGSASTQVE